MPHLRISRIVLFLALAASLMLVLPASAVAQRVGFGFRLRRLLGRAVRILGSLRVLTDTLPTAPTVIPVLTVTPVPTADARSAKCTLRAPTPTRRSTSTAHFAGRAHDLKRIYLAAGTYNIEQRIGTDVQKQRVYVIANRSLKIEFGKLGTPSPQPRRRLPPARPDRRLLPRPHHRRLRPHPTRRLRDQSSNQLRLPRLPCSSIAAAGAALAASFFSASKSSPRERFFDSVSS